MEVSETTTPDNVPVLRIAGDVDLSTSGELRTRLDELIKRGSAHIVVDLTDVEFFDSAGLKALADAHDTARAKGSALALVCPQERLLRLFKITGLIDTFSIEPTAERAANATMHD